MFLFPQYVTMKKTHSSTNCGHRCKRSYPSHIAHFRFKKMQASGSGSSNSMNSALSCLMELYAAKMSQKFSGKSVDDKTILQFDITQDEPGSKTDTKVCIACGAFYNKTWIIVCQRWLWADLGLPSVRVCLLCVCVDRNIALVLLVQF